MTSRQNSPNCNSRGPWDETLANDSRIFCGIRAFKTVCIYEWSAPLNTPTLPAPSEERRLWRAALLKSQVSVCQALVLSSFDENEVIPHLGPQERASPGGPGSLQLWLMYISCWINERNNTEVGYYSVLRLSLNKYESIQFVRWMLNVIYWAPPPGRTPL